MAIPTDQFRSAMMVFQELDVEASEISVTKPD